MSEQYLEENKDQIYENALAEIQSFELPLGTTLRYASFRYCYIVHDGFLPFFSYSFSQPDISATLFS